MHGVGVSDAAAQVMSELHGLLERLSKSGYFLHAFRVDLHGPEILGFVHDWGGLADVVILFDADRACAHRCPTGPGIDVFAPRRVLWSYASSPVWTVRALLTLAAPGHPDAPSGLHDAPPSYGLPVEGRMPMRIRPIGWH